MADTSPPVGNSLNECAAVFRFANNVDLTIDRCRYTMPMIMVVNAQLPVHSVKDVVALARSKSGGISFGSAGTGTG